ncbi:MAG: hypothetical protein PHT95_01235, partial [Candidatus Omnitrophica bacterium]|nr:hypothetical protein [Candidatus Omnitrophota bacterium]
MSKNSEKNLILAMAISMMILFGSQMLFKTNIKKPEIPPVVNVLNTGEKDSREIEKKQFLQNENDTAALGSEKLTETEQVIDTGKIIAVFSSKGASLKSLTVKDANHKEDNIYFENDPGKRIFAMDTALEAALSRKIFAVKEGDGFVEYRYLVPGKGEIVKKFIYKKDGDIVQAQIKIKNTSAQDLEVAYDMIGAAG